MLHIMFLVVLLRGGAIMSFSDFSLSFDFSSAIPVIVLHLGGRAYSLLDLLPNTDSINSFLTLILTALGGYIIIVLVNSIINKINK